MSWFDVYLFTRLDILCSIFQGFAIATTIIGGGVAVVCLMGAIEEQPEISKIGKMALKWAIPFLIFFGLGSILIPDTKQFAAIYLIPKIANNEQVQQIPENALKLLNLKFQAWLEDMEPAKK